MNLRSLFEVLVTNLVLLTLLAWVTGDYSARDAYWGPEGLVPTTVRYPLLIITSATGGSTSIPGLLAIDWQQVIVLVLLATDALYAWGALHPRLPDPAVAA